LYIRVGTFSECKTTEEMLERIEQQNLVRYFNSQTKHCITKDSALVTVTLTVNSQGASLILFTYHGGR
jgi:hypothetical protein